MATVKRKISVCFRYGAAIQDCDTALELDNTYVKAYARRATAKQSLGRLEEAMEDYEQLLNLQPDNKQALDGIEKVTKVIPNNTAGF
jgi:tetratricopeptide (TPR) repeat protein